MGGWVTGVFVRVATLSFMKPLEFGVCVFVRRVLHLKVLPGFGSGSIG